MVSLSWPAPACPPQEGAPSIMCPRLPRASMGHVVLLPPAAAVCLPSVYPEQRRVTPPESTLAEVFILNNLNPFRMNTCRAKPHFAQFWCNVTPFRINTCKSVSKQTTLSTFRINTYEKTGAWGIPSYRPIVPLPFSVHSSKFRIPQVLSLPFLCEFCIPNGSTGRKLPGYVPKISDSEVIARNLPPVTRHWIREGAPC